MGKNSYLVREIVGTMVFVQGLGGPCAKVCIGQIGPFLGQNFGHRLGHLANFSRVQWQRSAQPAPPPAKAGRLSKRPLFLIFWPLITTCLGILARSWFEGDWLTICWGCENCVLALSFDAFRRDYLRRVRHAPQVRDWDENAAGVPEGHSRVDGSNPYMEFVKLRLDRTYFSDAFLMNINKKLYNIIIL